MADATFIVRTITDVRDVGTNRDFGPFSDHKTAEECVIAVSTKAEVVSAKIIEEQT